VSLEGSFHSATMRKSEGALIGAITRGIVKGDTCFAGRATLLQETLPWHVTYEAFDGRLPNIDNIFALLRRYAWRIEETFLGLTYACLYKDQGRPDEDLDGYFEVEVSGRIPIFTALREGFGSIVSGGALCGRRLFINGQADLYLLGSSTTRITIRLI
jgi:hypothetical protein